MAKLSETKESIRTLQESYDIIAEAAEAYNTGKAELVSAINSKGVECSSGDTLPQLATKVEQINQNVYEIGESVTGEAIFPSDIMFNLITEAYAHVRGDYSTLVLAEFYKGYDTIPLNGADAYYTCDGDFYTSNTTHTWHDNELGKTNRYIIYYYSQEGQNFVIGDVNVCPRRMTVIGKLGNIICGVAGRITNIYNLGEINEIQFQSTMPWNVEVNIDNINDLTNGEIITDNTGVVNVSLGLKESHKPAVLRCTNLTSITFPLLESILIDESYRETGTLAALITGCGENLDNLSYANFPSLKYLNGGCLFRGWDRGGFNNLKNIGLDNLEVIGDGLHPACITGTTYFYNKNQFGKVKTLNLPKLHTIKSNGFLFSYYYAMGFLALEMLYIPMLEYVYNQQGDTGGIVGGASLSSLIDFEVGELKTSFNVSTWNPTNVLADSELTATLNANIRNHIAAKVSDRTGLSPLTFTVSTNLYNNLEQATKDAFAAKNWNVAGA